MADQAGIKGKSGLNPTCGGPRKKETHVGDVMSSKGNQATLGFDGLGRALRAVSACSNEHLLSPNLPKELVRISFVGLIVLNTSDPRFDGVEVSKVREPLLCLRDEVGEGRSRVFHPHRLPRIPRGDAESDPVLANDLGDRFNDFEREPGAVRDRSTVFVRSLIGHVLKELIWEVSVREVKLDSVEPGLFNGLFCCIGVPLDVSLDFSGRQWAGGRVGRRDRDGGCPDEFKAGILGFEQLDVCGATMSPELEEDVRAVCVDCIYDLWGVASFR